MRTSIRETIETLIARIERKVLDAFFRLSTAHPGLLLGLCLAGAALCVFYTWRHMEFVTGRMDMISSDKPYVKLDEEYSNDFTGLDPMIVAVQPRDVRQGKEFVSRLGEALKGDTTHVEEVLYQLDTSSLEGKKLLYLSPEDLESLRENLEDNLDLVHRLTAEPGVRTLFESVNTQVSSAMVSHLLKGLLGMDSSEGSEEEEGKKKPIKIHFLRSLLEGLNREMKTPDSGYLSPWADFFGQEKFSDDGYLISDNRRFMFLLVEPRESDNGGFVSRKESIDTIRRMVSSLQSEFPGLSAGVTGQKALNNDEMMGAQGDTQVATLVSLGGITLLYLLFFRNLRHPLVIAATLLLGLCWTMGMITLTVGHLTIITVFVAPLLLGLADDFAVHFVSRYEEERTGGRNAVDALRIVFEHTAPGIVAGGWTTSIAFFAVMLTDFRGVRELGWITGVGLLLYLVLTMTFLPSTLLIIEAVRPWKPEKGARTFFAEIFRRYGTALDRARRPVLVLASLATFASLLAMPRVSFDYNLLNLQARGTESVVWERRILDDGERSSWKALSRAATLEETVLKAAAFEALPAVENVESVAMLIPENQETRLERVRALKPILADSPEMIGTPAQVDVSDLKRTLSKLKLKIRPNNDKWDPEKRPSEAELEAVRGQLEEAIGRLDALPPEEARARLQNFQGNLVVDFQEKWDLLRRNLDPQGPITLSDVPEQIRSRWISRDGTKFLLAIYPRRNIWDRQPLEEFIGQIQQVDPDTAGSPIVGYESIRAMKEGYSEAGLYALAAVVIVTFLTLRRVGDTLLAMIPLALGMTWTAGCMWLVGLQFNLANLIVVPLIIGIGLENGIHIVHRYREQGESGTELAASSTGQSIVLFSLTTMVGFGSLMVARYYGIFSIGLLLTLSVGSVLIASMAVLPLLLPRPGTKRRGGAGAVLGCP